MSTADVADVLVIGAGASGAAAAWRLSEAGFAVVCLEQGGWHRPEDYPQSRPDWELRVHSEWAFDPNARQLPQDYPVVDENSDVSPLMFNAVGGSTIHWTGHTPRFHPSDFRVKTLDGVADDWPLAYADLEPYYDLNDRMMGCSGVNGDPANPPRSARPMPPLPLGPDGVRLAQAFDRLGWHWWPSDSYINSVAYDGRQACNNCGPNGLGCPRGAKGSTDITYWPRAIELGAEVRPHCRVFELTTAADGRLTGAGYIDADGERRHQPARAVMVACNGVGTPRLLLMSAPDRQPRGLANSSGMLGKNLMFHPYGVACGLFPDGEPTYKGPLGNVIISQQFYETDPERDFVRGYSFQMNRSSGPGWTAVGQALPAVAWGESHHRKFAARFARSSYLLTITEDLPEERNRVTLDATMTDSDGLPAPRVTYSASANTRRMLAHGIVNASRVLREAGATQVLTDPLLRGGGWHLMGTARMGDDPERSVVDRYGQAHDADNLFVVDGSLFVTSAAVNPTPTIQALALWVADYIARDRADLRG